MDRYRYFVFNQRSMVMLGLFQIALSTVCVVSGFTDGIFRMESQLGKTRAPVWAGMVMGVPGVLALISSQRKNPVLVNVLIVASLLSCVAILIVIVYSSLTLNYGEEEELSSAPVHVIHTKFVLNKVVKGANLAMLAASISSVFVVLVMASLGCRSLPRCSCYNSVTGMVLEAKVLTSQISFHPRTWMQRKTHPNPHHTSGWLEKAVEHFKATSLKMWLDRGKKFFVFEDG
ncbi:uncharacterized protein LOC127384879 isoform X1 [Apus apus]|uniref:uncharacterized protein LOC127384879 isoform X1 n=1 Tax=Apus apus TaxID=8895 RepID=UPI0021F89280|nr:uncharacterized protein LOC127384879 isoform X1 [Apus apus]